MFSPLALWLMQRKTRRTPRLPNWLVGIGISLQEQGRNSDAAEAFARARDGGLLNAQLLEFVEQRLQQLP